MKLREYLSPTQISKWKENQEMYYMKYLSDVKLPREKQTLPMSVGSAFDAYIKSDLYHRLVGKGDPKYSFEGLFDLQVEEHNRDFARKAGKICYDQYVSTGALADLLIEMQGSLGEPKFEIEVRGTISHGGREVVLLGKPDVFFINKQGGHVALDFKVNGYCSKSPVSPMKGYLRLHPGCLRHKDCVPSERFGFKLNVNHKLEDLNADWAAQLSTYAWLCGCDIGTDWVAAIDQIACAPPKKNDFVQDSPNIRVAQHRLLVTPQFQFQFFSDACDLWDITRSDHVFRHMSREDSLARCQVLDMMVEDMVKNGNIMDQLRGE